MIRRLTAPLIGCAMLVGAPVGASIQEGWLEVQEVLSASEGASLQEPIDELIQAADEIDVRRMTPQASALVSWSQSHSEQEEEGAQNAARLDPELPTSYFMLSRSELQDGSYLGVVGQYARGWLALFRYEVTRRYIFISFGIWLIAGLAMACASAVVVMTLRTVRRLAHDAMAIGRMVFDRGNAFVFALVILLLPLFAGLGPIWLVVYLFVGGWIYFDRSQRIVAFACCAILAFVPMILEGWQMMLLRVPPVTERVAVMLDERQLNPSSLREFIALREELDGDSRYHLILGELFRMHSELESAKIEFQSASLEPFGDARSLVILGNMALEDGNVQLAIQNYDEAINTDGSTALAYHNLSSAYDLNRRFQQGDAARAKARQLAGGRSASLGVRGRDPRVRYPSITSRDVQELVNGLTPEQRLSAGFSAPTLQPVRQLLSPVSMVFWLGGLVGVAMLVVRSRWFSPSKECAKCGKVYRLDDEPGESAVYCRQCVSVFLQRELVPIDQQTAKLAQVRRWDRWSAVLRRLVSILAPGSYQLVTDQVSLGVVVGLLAWASISGVVIWVPRFLKVIEPTMAVLPLFVLLWVLFALSWIRSIASSWQRR